MQEEKSFMAEPFKHEQIMVCTANVCGQNWMGLPWLRPVAKRVFADTDAQLFGLQELTEVALKAFQEVRSDLLYYTGMMPNDTDLFVNAIAYFGDRFTKGDHGTFWLSDDKSYIVDLDGVRPRGVSYVVFYDNLFDRKFLMVNTQLDNKGVKARIHGVELILKLINDMTAKYEKVAPDMPVIFTADANVSVDSPLAERWGTDEMQKPYQMFMDAGFTDCWKATHPRRNHDRPMTYHNFQGLDYTMDEFGTWDTDMILVRGFKPWNCNVIRDSYGSTYPSDHFWVKAQLAYEKK